MDNVQALIETCDADIRSGRASLVEGRLAKLDVVRLKRNWRLPLAKICRRAGLFNLGLRILYKIIHNETPGGESIASAAESAEYAVLLQRSGALREALEKLERVDTTEAPEALLYRAFTHFARWEFAEAIPILESFLSCAPSSYSALVGRTNLAFALTELRLHERAVPILEETIRLAGKDGNQQIQSNCHALLGQVWIQEQKFSQARRDLEFSLGLVRSTGEPATNDQFFITKWLMILNGLEGNSKERFRELRQMALRLRSWEALREADLFSLKVDYNRERFVHLYFGSPYAGFRERFKQELGSVPSQAMYVLGSKESPRFDLRTGIVDGRDSLSPVGKTNHLLSVLLRDFYRPHRINGLFAELFPDEELNATTSPHRVQQLISRARRWLKDQDIPVSINESEGFYSLKIDGKFSFRIPLDHKALGSEELSLLKLQSEFADGQSFTVRDVVQKLNVSQSTAHRIVQRALKDGAIEASRDGRKSFTYKIVSAGLAETAKRSA